MFGGVFGLRQVQSLKTKHSDAVVKLATVPAQIQGGNLDGILGNIHFNPSVR